MFTLKQIKEAHSYVKSGADFPLYIQALRTLGVKEYTVFVEDGHTEYRGDGGFVLLGDALYHTLTLGTVNSVLFKELLQKHQAGETNYLTFCEDSARNGVEKWVVDTDALTCTYFNHDTIMLVEHIAPKNT